MTSRGGAVAEGNGARDSPFPAAAPGEHRQQQREHERDDDRGLHKDVPRSSAKNGVSTRQSVLHRRLRPGCCSEAAAAPPPPQERRGKERRTDLARDMDTHRAGGRRRTQTLELTYFQKSCSHDGMSSPSTAAVAVVTTVVRFDGGIVAEGALLCSVDRLSGVATIQYDSLIGCSKYWRHAQHA